MDTTLQYLAKLGPALVGALELMQCLSNCPFIGLSTADLMTMSQHFRA